MTENKTLSFRETLSCLEDNHIATLRQIRTQGTATHRQSRKLCAIACVYAHEIRMDAERRSEFYAEAFPSGWKRFHRKKLLLHVLMYFYGATDHESVGYGTASAHSIALRGLYENRNVCDDDVMRHIESSGIFPDLQEDDDDSDESGKATPTEQECDDRPLVC